MSEYPEHDKLRQIAPLSQAIGEFMDWVAAEHHITLAEWHRGDLIPVHARLTKLLAEHFGIDEDALEDEKRAMLARQREMNDAR